MLTLYYYASDYTSVVVDADLLLPKPLPTSTTPLNATLTLLHKVEVSNRCYSVSHYKGQTYVGHEKGVDKIDGNYQRELLIKSDAPVYAIAVKDDKMYTLVNEKPQEIEVHSLQGQMITGWIHPDYCDYLSSLVIVSNNIVIPDRTNSRLTLYSQTGKIIKHIAFPQFGRYTVSLCAVGTDSVIATNYSSPQVLLVNIISEAIIWTSEHVAKPLSVARSGQDHVCIADGEGATIWIIDIGTGW